MPKGSVAEQDAALLPTWRLTADQRLLNVQTTEHQHMLDCLRYPQCVTLRSDLALDDNTNACFIHAIDDLVDG